MREPTNESWDDEELDRRISRWLDRRMTGQEADDFRRDLAVDEGLRQRLAELESIDALAGRALRAALDGADREPPVAVVTERQRSASGHFRLRWAVAALLLVALGAWWLVRPDGSDGPVRPRGPGAGGEHVARPDAPPGALEGVVDPGSPIDTGVIGPRAAGADDWLRVPRDCVVPTPAVLGTGEGERWRQSRVLSVYDEERDEMHLYEIDRIRTQVRPVRLDL